MEDVVDPGISQGKNSPEGLRNWMMVALSLIFVFLYGAALFGFLKPLADMTMITRLEPIIFVIIGYYFGRLPAQQNEKTLKEEISRQTQKADAAQYTKEKVLQEREVLEEKVKNAKVALARNSVCFSSRTAIGGNDSLEEINKNLPVCNSIEIAASILNS